MSATPKGSACSSTCTCENNIMVRWNNKLFREEAIISFLIYCQKQMSAKWTWRRGARIMKLELPIYFWNCNAKLGFSWALPFKGSAELACWNSQNITFCVLLSYLKKFWLPITKFLKLGGFLSWMNVTSNPMKYFTISKFKGGKMACNKTIS